MFIKLLPMNVENLQCRDRVANQTCNRIVAVNKWMYLTTVYQYNSYQWLDNENFSVFRYIYMFVIPMTPAL